MMMTKFEISTTNEETKAVPLTPRGVIKVSMLQELQESGNLLADDQDKYLECLETFRIQNLKAPKDPFDFDMSSDSMVDSPQLQKFNSLPLQLPHQLDFRQLVESQVDFRKDG